MENYTPTASARTPGPWRTEWLGDEPGWILDDQCNYIAEIVTKDDEGFVVPRDQQQANARLIAAAPDLLHAAYLALDEIRQWDEVMGGSEDARTKDAISALRDAINKAERL